MSLRKSILSPRPCSGLMYSGVPMIWPVAVRLPPVPSSLPSLAMPKSMRRMTPLASRMMFGVLRSRWMMPTSWMAWRPSASWMAEGLQAIHDVGIIHRDLKTPNIMRDAKGVIRLMDFGIAKEGSEEGTGGSLTATGQIMGTPEYMSPEQGRGERIDFRSDIYALGVVDYEMFTGQVPFRGDTPVATIFKHIQDPVPLEGGLASRIPGSAVPLLRKALAKDRTARFASAGEMAEALRQARAAAAGSPPPFPAAGATTPSF